MTILEEGVSETEVAETPIPAEEPASEGAEATEGVEPEAAVEAEPIDYLDTDAIGDQMVKLTVDGVEHSVPLSEALAGYNSNAAATQRFQEAAAIKDEAAQALNLAKALQSNPGMTMTVLANQAGLTVEQFLNLSPQQQQSVAAVEPEPEFSDPLEKALHEERTARIALEQRFEQREQEQQASQADNALQQAVANLQTQHGATPEDARAVVTQAWNISQQTGQYVGIEMFEMIYQSQQYQKSQVTTQAQADANAASAAENLRRQNAAAQASGAVGTGSGAVGTAPGAVAQPTTPESAVRAALDELGITD
jgi:hypothetical protein